jgi:hypothetical protein
MKHESQSSLFSSITCLCCNDITLLFSGGNKEIFNALSSKSSASLLLRSVSFRLVVAVVIISSLWLVLSQLL